MTDTLLAEILAWSVGRAGWQRDALRRLFTSGTVTPVDIDDLVDLCKAAKGLSAPRAPQPLASEHLPITGAATEPISLSKVTHHRGVNALAAEQSVTFGPKLTIVYGQNAAGKSGYTRILKRACRSRASEDVLGNVLSNETPLNHQATIVFRQGEKELSFAWTRRTTPSPALASVSVFDAQCAPVYLRDRTDLAFRPFGLDAFDKLAITCDEVRVRLEGEERSLRASTLSLPVLPENTTPRAIVDNLTSLTNPETVRIVATLSDDEERRLAELRRQRLDLVAADPKQRGKELSLKAQRIERLAAHVTLLCRLLGDGAQAALRSQAASLRAALGALAILRKTAVSEDLLPGTGGVEWQSMWEAAGEFSKISSPDSPFPALDTKARCPFCQQIISPDAATTLSHLHEYFTSNAQTEARQAEAAYNAGMATATVIDAEPPEVSLATDELASDYPDLAQRVRDFLIVSKRTQDSIRHAIGQDVQMPTEGLPSGLDTELRSIASAVRKRATALAGQSATLDPNATAELCELEARSLLKANLQAVFDEIDRKKRLAVYRQCVEDTSTNEITRKSTELTTQLVTDQLRKTFQEELAKLDFAHLAVEITPAGGTKGALFHRLVFSDAPSVTVTSVLSEGEARALSLAAFLTELTTASTNSAIIFDDPVSSLDHIWRERIARRLVEEADTRQVIVFTHDLLFLRFLMAECDRKGMESHHQYIRRLDREAGLCSTDLPWIAMKTKDRIATLHRVWQAADKLYRTGDLDSYEREAREIYGLLREAWEQAVPEVLLNDVVERYRNSIETKKVHNLHDITEEDCSTVENGMTECSRWIRGHDQPPADGTPFPKPGEVKKRIDDLEEWAQRIRKRRK